MNEVLTTDQINTNTFDGNKKKRYALHDFLGKQGIRSRPGLIQRKTKVHRGGKVYERMQWVRPEEARTVDLFEQVEVLGVKRNQVREHWHDLVSLRLKALAILKQYPKEGNKKIFEQLDNMVKEMRNRAENIDTDAEAVRDEVKRRKIEPRIDSFAESDSEKKLATSGVKEIKNLGGGANETRKIVLEDGSKAIFKPKSGEVRLRDDIPKGKYYIREVAAYKIAKLLRFEYCPETVIRDIDGEIGSVQRWVEEGDYGEYSEISDADVERLACFDWIIGNEDRHGENWLWKESEKKPYAIDHGLSFPESKRPDWFRSVFWGEMKSRKLPVSDEIKNLFQTKLLDNERQITRSFAKLGLSSKAIDGMFYRVRDLISTGGLGV